MLGIEMAEADEDTRLYSYTKKNTILKLLKVF